MPGERFKIGGKLHQLNALMAELEKHVSNGEDSKMILQGRAAEMEKLWGQLR